MLDLDYQMKNKRNILSLFNLLFFLGSFVMISITSFSNSSKNPDSFHLKHHLSSKKYFSDNSSQILSEENIDENETENDHELQTFILPFFISCFSLNAYQFPITSVTPLTEKLTNPIYLSVCNFRI